MGAEENNDSQDEGDKEPNLQNKMLEKGVTKGKNMGMD